MRAACRRSAGAALVCVALSCALFPAQAAAPDEGTPRERIPTHAVLNGVARGELFAWRDKEGLWVALKDLESLGVPVAGAETRDISGLAHARLDRLEGITARLNEDTLTLAIDIDPRLMPPQRFDLSRVEDLSITPFSDVSGFLNLGITADHSSSSTSSTAYEGRVIGNLAAGGWILRSEHEATQDNGPVQWLRLRTFAQRDWPSPMLRLLLGDFDTSAGSLSRGVSLAGVSFGSDFDLRPGFVSAPTARVTGIAATASTAQIYVDGLLVATRPVQPGAYDFTNLQDFSGLRNVEVVLRDASGIRAQISIPYYFSEQLLKQGLTDFNVSWGAQRDEVFSDSYGAGMFSGHWTYGVSDALTLGVEAQRSPGYGFAGAVGGVRIGNLGVVGVETGVQRLAGGQNTFAAIAAWTHTNGPTTLRLGARGYGEGFSTTEGVPTILMPQLKRETTAGWDQNFGRFFLLSLGAAERRYYGPFGLPEREYNASVSIPVFGGGTLSFNALNGRIAGQKVNEASINFSMTWGDRKRASTGWRRDSAGVDTYYAQVGRAEPQGEGVGWRAFVQDSPAEHDVQGDAVWRARHGIVSVSANQSRFEEGPSSSGARVSADAALACVGASCYVTRPVNDSFAVVDLNGVEDVRVSRNNELIGSTDRNGEIVIADVPSLSRNAIEIADEDVPISVSVPLNEQILVPADGVGYRVHFDLRHIASVTGRLVHGAVPVENHEFTLREPDAPPRSLRTGREGQFQIDQLSAGRYQVQVELEDGVCSAWIEVPQNREPIFQAGEVRCETTPNR